MPTRPTWSETRGHPRLNQGSNGPSPEQANFILPEARLRSKDRK